MDLTGPIHKADAVLGMDDDSNTFLEIIKNEHETTEKQLKGERPEINQVEFFYANTSSLCEVDYQNYKGTVADCIMAVCTNPSIAIEDIKSFIVQDTQFEAKFLGEALVFFLNQFYNAFYLNI